MRATRLDLDGEKLLRALLGLLPKDAGRVLWNGDEVVNHAAFFRPPVSAYTPQVPRLFSERTGAAHRRDHLRRQGKL